MKLPLLNLFKATKKNEKKKSLNDDDNERNSKIKKEKHIYCDNVEVIIG